MEEIALQIEQIAARANAWCNFAIWCGWIGFGLSLVCAVWLILKTRHERNL